MEIDQLKLYWKQYDEKLDRNWKLNMHLLRTTNTSKARNELNKLTWVIGITLAFYVLATYYFVHFTIGGWPSPYLVGSGAILSIWTLIISVGCVHELELISRIDFSEPVATVQGKLLRLKLIIIRYLRLVVWIFPFFMAFIAWFFKALFGIDIMLHADPTWLWSNVAIGVLVFLPFSIWAHRKLSPKNANKPWMNKLIIGNGSQINKALEFIGEIDEFDKER
ncbi:hypothetical protein [Marinoscillum furvescens]|uniref:Serine/threonine protein kinase n=1 Tax=Marinoscillum furvescens DSM 4134 TaxID=1122208 RepID=A0A3D9LI02_MARFU|nr:hypothetical protein [Marinoscillum furvescens]REE05659.1 hypothetical protein C7460_101176 [Marinoscillum furvescens DSM 4134]